MTAELDATLAMATRLVAQGEGAATLEDDNPRVAELKAQLAVKESEVVAMRLQRKRNSEIRVKAVVGAREAALKEGGPLPSRTSIRSAWTGRRT